MSESNPVLHGIDAEGTTVLHKLTEPGPIAGQGRTAHEYRVE
jgi:hypothetical protein